MDTPEDIIPVMQKDLARALEKGERNRRFAMIIDTRKCVGCHSCTVGCIAENASSRGIMYRPVYESEWGKYPAVRRRFVPRPCMHCDSPPCVGVCPKKGKATYKSTSGLSSGMVVVDYAECIQCDKCIKVCPYKARGRDEGYFHSDQAPFVPAYEKRASDEYGKVWPRDGVAIKAGTVRKCHFCLHRLAKGMLPTCVTTCLGRATYFGDENDATSLIAKVKHDRLQEGIRMAWISRVTDYSPLKGEVIFGGNMTSPRVYYILS